MLEVADVTGLVAIVGNGRAGKVERAALRVGHNFHRVRIVDVLGRTGGLYGPHLYSRILHQLNQSINVIGMRKRFVSLHVDIDVRGHGLRDFVHAVGATAMACRSHAGGPSIALTDREDLIGVSGDDHVGECAASTRSFINALQHGLPCDLAQHLPRQTAGSDARGNDGNDFHRKKGRRRLLQKPEIVSSEH